MKIYKPLLLSIMLAFCSNARASNEPLVYFKGDPHFIHHFPDPVNLKNGNLYLPATDIFFSAGNVNLIFSRFYNSNQADKPGPLGFGWRHGLMTVLSEPMTGVIKIVEADGYTTFFGPTIELKTALADKITAKRKDFEISQGKPLPDSHYAKFREKMIKDLKYLFEMNKIYFPAEESNVAGSFTSSQRQKQILIKNEDGYQRRYSDGRVEYFDKGGRLVKLEDRNGNFLGLEYAAGKLSSIFDKNGLSLRISHNAQDMISNIKDPIGRIFSYSYDKEGNLKKTQGFRKESESYDYDKSHRMTGITLADGGKVKIEYDSLSRVTVQKGPGVKLSTYNYKKSKGMISGEVIDGNGNKRIFKFASDGSKTQEIDPLGRTRTVFFNTQTGNISKISDEAGNITELFHDSQGNLIKTVNPQGMVKTFEYGGPQNKITKTTQGDVTTKFVYDGAGSLTSMEMEDSRRFLYRYDKNGNLVRTVSPSGKITNYGYDESGRLTTQTDPAGNKVEYKYDAAGRMIESKAQDGTSFKIGYDDSNNIVSLTDEIGNELKAEYDKANRLSAIIDPRGAKTVYKRNEMGLLESTQNVLGHKFTYSYDAASNMTKIVNPQGGIYSYKYDGLNRLAHEEYPNGQSKSYAYDEVGNLVSHKRSDGLTENYSYDSVGRLTSWTMPDGHLRYEYGYGSITQTDERGNRISAIFDRAGNIVEKHTPQGISFYKYDNESRLTEEKTPSGKILRYFYDKLGRPTQTRDGESILENMVYDSRGRVIEQTIGGLSWQYTYDPAGRLLEAKNPEDKTVKFSYNKQGDLTGLTDTKGNTESYRYNPEGQLIARTYPDGTADYADFNKLGRVKSKTFPNGARIFYTYDPAGNIEKVTDGKSDLARYSYDKSGRVIKAENSDTSFEYAYDELNRIVLERDLKRNKTLNFTYDRFSNLKTVSDSQKLLRKFTYNKGNLVTKIEDENGGVYKIKYTSDDMPAKILYPNGILLKYGYSDGRIAQISAQGKDKKNIYHVKYAYDPSGRLKGEAGSLGNRQYSYDAMGRLVNMKGDKSLDYTYEYDSSDNRIVEKVSGKTNNYTYDGMNRLLSLNDKKLEYDKKGNLQKKGPFTFAYNGFDQLVSVEKDGKRKLEIAYDAFGRKYSTFRNSSKIYHRHLHFHPLLDENEKGETLSSVIQSPHLRDIDSPLGVLASGKAFYPIQDAKKNTVKITDGDGKTLESANYEPFGKPKREDGRLTDTLAFAGRPFDKETGLIDYRYRHFDTETGRFLTKDPVYPVTGLNAYTYPANNPVDYRDPLGLFGFYGAGSSVQATKDPGTSYGSGPGPGPGPSPASTGTGAPAQAAKAAQPVPPPMFVPKQPNAWLLMGMYVGIPLGAKVLSKVFRKDLSDVTKSFNNIPNTASNTVNGQFAKLLQKIVGTDSGPFYEEEKGPFDPALNMMQFKKDLVKFNSGDMTEDEFLKRYGERIEGLEKVGLCGMKLTFKSGESEQVSICDYATEIAAAEAKAKESKQERTYQPTSPNATGYNPYSIDPVSSYLSNLQNSARGGYQYGTRDASAPTPTPTVTPTGTGTLPPATGGGGNYPTRGTR